MTEQSASSRALRLWQFLWRRRNTTAANVAAGAFVAAFAVGLVWPNPWLSQMLVYVLLLPAALWLLPQMRGNPVLLNLLLAAIALLLAASLIGTLSAAIEGPNSNGKLVGMALLIVAVCSALGAAGRFDRRLPAWMGRWLSLAAGASAAILLLHGAGNVIFGQVQLHGDPDYQWVLNPNALGAVYAMCFAVAITHSASRMVVAPERLAALCVAVLLIVTIVLMQSRGALLACIGAVLATTFALPRRIVIGLAAAGVAVVLVLLLLSPAWVDYFTARGDGERIAIWRHFLDLSAERPWFGYGANFDPRFEMNGHTVHTPHNMLLSVLVRSGIVGLVAMLATLVVCAVAAVGAAKRGWWAPIATLVASTVAAAVDHDFDPDTFSYFWYLYWLPFGLAAYAAGQPARRDRSDGADWLRTTSPPTAAENAR